MQKIYNPVWDITKFVLSIFVVMIHTSFFSEYSFPWVRIAVPLFFMISSYFFFTKFNASQSKKEKEALLGGFVIRNLKLYAFWFVVLLPITLYTRNYFKSGILSGILKMLRAFLFSGTFTASWYIMALIIGTVIICKLSYRFKTRTLLWASVAVYILVSLRSSYFFLFENVKLIAVVTQAYETVFMQPYLSFPVSFFWIMCGKLFAEGFLQKKEFCRAKKLGSAIMVLVFAALFYAEWYVVRMYSGEFKNDCYMLLAPLCICIFYILLHIKITASGDTSNLRKLSTVIYAMHGSAIPVVNKALKFIGVESGTALLVLVVFVCIVCGMLLVRLSKVRGLGILKYSY